MNMIPTGAFLTEMDASEKKETLAEQFVSIWEKKNSKIARAGGVSLMALSLAACGGSSDTAATDTPAAETPAEETETPAAETPAEETPAEEEVVEEVTPVTTALVAGEDTTGTAGDDSFTAATGPLTADKTIVGTDDIAGGEGTDTIAISLGADFGGFTTTGTDTGSMTGVEVVELSAADSIARSFDATGVSGVTTYKVDGTNAVVSIADSADLAALELSNIASGAFSITYAAPTGGTSPVAGTDDTLNLTVEGLGSATADIAITAAGVETLSITSNAAATAAGATNYMDLSGVSSATTIEVAGAADTDIAAVSTTTTALNGADATGAITAALGNAAAGALATVKTGAGDDTVTAAYADLTATAEIAMGAGDDTLKLTGETAAAVSQYNMSGVETLDISSVATTAGQTTVSLAKASTAPSTLIAGVSKTGADVDYEGNLNFVSDSGAKSIDLIGDSTAGAITTDTSGAIDIDVTANSAATATALSANAAAVTANSASSLDLSVTGNVNYTGAVSASKATSVTVTNAGAAQSGMQISAAKAETVSITTDKNLTLSDGNTTLTGAKSITIDTAGAFVQDDAGATDTEGFTAAQTLTLSGAGSKASATFDSLVGADDLAYSMTINASGLKGGLTFGNDVDAGSGSLTVDASGVTGAVDMSKMDAAGTVTFTASSLGANTLDVITAKNVVINGSEALGGITYATGNDIVAGSSVTIDGPSVSATDVDIIASATATSLTVDVDGGIVADNIDVTGTTTVKTITVSGDAGVGADVYTVTLANYGTDTTSTVTVDMSGVVADTTNQSAVTIDIDAEVTNKVSVTGSKGSNDTVNIDGAVNYSTNGLVLSAVEKVTIDDAVTMDASTISGQTIEFTGVSDDVVTLNGTASADTIDLEDITTGGTKAANTAIQTNIDAGVGADTITVTTGAQLIDTVKIDDGDTGAWNIDSSNAKVASTANFDVITGLAAGDKIDLTGAVQTEADYDNFTTATAGANLTATATTDTIAQFIGTYDSAAGTFTSDTTGDDLMLAFNGADASDTTVDSAFILVGMTNVLTNAEITDGVITIA